MTTHAPLDEPSTDAAARRTGPRRSRRWLLAPAAVVVAAASAGATFAAGLWDAELEQNLCGLTRADDTPLGFVLPKDRPGVESRTLSDDSLGGHGKLTCVISVDGHEVVRVLLFAVDPDRPTGTGISATARSRIGQGVTTGPGAATLTDYCPDTQTLAAVATVTTDPTIWPGPAEDQTPTRLALGDLVTTVLAQQRRQICH
ncbi:hypothetical protein [Kitasatospora sp. NPDC091207]|uniref:hypothetical protein n=1 Tax=Kitasatospora sp. NPDC091207 TaxID=3364083 RepID=UPI003826BF99